MYIDEKLMLKCIYSDRVFDFLASTPFTFIFGTPFRKIIIDMNTFIKLFLLNDV